MLSTSESKLIENFCHSFLKMHGSCGFGIIIVLVIVSTYSKNKITNIKYQMYNKYTYN